MKPEYDLRIKRPNKSGAYLKALRLNLGTTRKEAAQAIGCTAQTLRRYERTGIPEHISALKIYSIISYYDISADELLANAAQPA